MLNVPAMSNATTGRFMSAIFITFPGNCRTALTYYQTCFGGTLQFETFDMQSAGYAELPVVSGSLVSDSVTIYGSDLVHDEGRTLGNYLSIFLHCKNTADRKALIEKLRFYKQHFFTENDDEQKLVELTDAFDVRWVLGV